MKVRRMKRVGICILIRGTGAGMESNWLGNILRPLKSPGLVEHETGCQENSGFQNSVGTFS